MLVDNLDYFKTAGASTDTLVAGTTVEVFSDARKYPPEGKHANGAGEKIIEFLVDVSTAGAGASYALGVYGCATEGGTYVKYTEIDVPRATVTAAAAKGSGGVVARLRLPFDLPLFIKARAVGASGMTGSTTFKARLVHG